MDHEPQIPEEKDRYKEALNYSIRLLSARDYSIYKMKSKLSSREFSSHEINQVIDQLVEYKYLQEEEYKKMRIKQLLVKGFANEYITRKIAQEELMATDLDINFIREEEDLGSGQQLKQLIDKKLRHKEIPADFELKMKLKQKILSFLVAKGYGFEDAQKHLDTRFT
jgi:SOS response regulatory protein OraA/RecX